MKNKIGAALGLAFFGITGSALAVAPTPPTSAEVVTQAETAGLTAIDTSVDSIVGLMYGALPFIIALVVAGAVWRFVRSRGKATA